MKSAVSGLSAIVVLFAVPAADLCADDEPRLFPSDVTIMGPATVLNLISQAAVREDLKLSEEQAKRIQQMLADARGATPGVDPGTGRPNFEQMQEQAQQAQAMLAEILTPAQVRRHRQIVMQHVAMTSGLSELLEIPEIASDLLIDADQQQALNEIWNTMQEAAQAAMQELMQARRLQASQAVGIFTNRDLNRALYPPQLYELNERSADRISAVLTTAQKKRLLESMGPPLAERLPALSLVGRLPVVRFAGGRGRVRGGGRGGRGGGFPILRLPTLPAGEASEPWPGIGKKVLGESSIQLGLLAAESVRLELKLTAEEVASQVAFGGDAAELLRSAKELGSWLKPGQVDRLQQLVLQVAVRRNGPAAVFEFQEVVDSLQLNGDQRNALTELVRSELQSTRHLVLQAIERDPEKCTELEKEVTERLERTLTDAQRKQLALQLGEPFRGELFLATIDRALEPRPSTRSRSTTSLGELTDIPTAYLGFGPLRDEMQLTDEQREAIPESRLFAAAAIAAGLQRALVPDHPKLLELLTADQLRRYKEILLQGGVRRDGPAMIFRYKFVVDALAPTDDQRRQLLEIVRKDTREYLRIPQAALLEKQPDLDAATAKDLETILTDAQREKLAQLLGEPAKCLDEPVRPIRRVR